MVGAFCKGGGGAVHVKSIALQVYFDIIIGGGGEEADGVVWCDGVVFFAFFWRGSVFYFFWRGGLVVVLVFGEDVRIKEGLKEGEDLVGGGGHVIVMMGLYLRLLIWGWWIIFLFLFLKCI